LNLDAASNSASSATNPSKFYAVASGHRPGIYTDWPSAQKQITGWTKPKHKSFSTRAEAEQYLRNTRVEKDASPTTASTSDGSELALEGILPSKRVKMLDGFTSINGATEDLPEPGTDPLPPDAEDGFDDRIFLDPSTGKIRWKTPAELAATKPEARVDNQNDMLYVYTDGACRANGQQGSVAGVGVFFGDDDPRYKPPPPAPTRSPFILLSPTVLISSTTNTSSKPRNLSEPLLGPRQTNQRAELTALKRALDLTPLNRSVHIFSDSQYAINCVTKWFHTWRQNNWHTSSKRVVENRDVIEEVLARIEEREVVGVGTRFEWLKGHDGAWGNEEADRLAVEGARDARRRALVSGVAAVGVGDGVVGNEELEEEDGEDGDGEDDEDEYE